MYAAKAPMASFATRKGASPRFNSRAIAPLPSLAICKRIQRIVNCASSQFMANRRRLLESAFTRWGSLTVSNSVEPWLPITSEPPNRMVRRFCRHGRKRDSLPLSKRNFQSNYRSEKWPLICDLRSEITTLRFSIPARCGVL